MTTLIARAPHPRRSPRRATRATGDAGHVTLYGIRWVGYVAFLDAVGERPIRVNYDDGVMEIMTISSEHEAAKKRIGGLVEDLAIELGIEIAPRGSTTFRSERVRKGLEPDECYYIANERKIRARKQIDLRRDPPPDLVIEIDVSRSSLDKIALYAAMDVPEVWRFDDGRLAIGVLVAGRYEESATSRVLPLLTRDIVDHWLAESRSRSRPEWMWAVLDWARSQQTPDESVR